MEGLTKYIMNLYKLHKNPKGLDHHEDAYNHIPVLIWEKFGHSPTELNKKEKAIATSAKYSYLYALYSLNGPFKLGEPSIAKDGNYSYLYARDILNGPFKLGEPSIAKNAIQSYNYAEDVLKGPFKLGEPAIDKDSGLSEKYKMFLSSLK